MHKLVSAVRVVSSIIFIGVLLLAYAYLLDGQSVRLEEGGQANFNTERFFYAGLITFSLVNIILFAFIKFTSDIKIKGEGQGIFGNANRKQGFVNWLNLFNASVNILLACLAGYILFINAPEELNLDPFKVLFLVGPLLLLVAIVSFPFMIRKQ